MRLLSRLLATVVIVCPPSNAPAKEEQAGEAPVAHVRVQIVDAATREPIAGGRVFTEQGGLPPEHFGGRYSSRSRLRFIERMQRRDLRGKAVDAEGIVTIEPDTPGRWLIEAWADGYVKQWREVVLGCGPLVADLEFRLPRSAAIEGAVTDTEGNTLAGALIYASPHYGTEEHSVGGSAFTDGEGRYHIAHVPRGHTVFVSATPSQAGFQAKHEKLETTDAENRLDLVVEQRARGPTVRGIIVDAAGKPVAGAMVEEDSAGLSEARSVVTGEDGRFVIEDVEANPPRLIVHASGFCLQQVKPGKADGELSYEAKVTLLPGYHVSGQVVDERGQPLGEVGIAFWKPTGRFSSEPLGATITDAKGQFELDALPGECQGTFIKPGCAAITNVDVTTHGSQPLHIVLSRDRVLKGKVTDASSGEPLTSFKVRAQMSLASTLAIGRNRDFLDRQLWHAGVPVFSRDGAFEIAGLPADLPCEMIVDAGGYLRQFSQPVSVAPRAESQPTQLALEADDPARYVHYQGRLIDDAGAAVAGAELRLVVAVPRPEGGVARTGFNARRGRMFMPAGFRPQYALDLRRMRSGAAAADVQVVRFEKAVSDARGRFEFARIPRTRQIALAWWGPGMAPGWKHKLEGLSDEEAGHLEVNVPPPSSATFRVDRRTMPGLLKVDASAKLVGGPTVETDLPEDRDEVTLEDLAEGQYLATFSTVTDRDGQQRRVKRARHNFSVGRGEHLEVELTEADLTKGK